MGQPAISNYFLLSYKVALVQKIWANKNFVEMTHTNIVLKYHGSKHHAHNHDDERKKKGKKKCSSVIFS